MKIFSAEQIKNWDKFTITHEPITSYNLMERAAGACFKWLITNYFGDSNFKIFCGKGNNGGDGLAIARMLIQNNLKASVYISELVNTVTGDFTKNLESLQTLTNDIHFIKSVNAFPVIIKSDVLIDALFGTGLNKPVKGIAAGLIEHINNSGATIISIDVPSGLFADKSSKENVVVKADFTLTFQQNKLAFMMAENELYFGDVTVLDIGLHNKFLSEEASENIFIDEQLIKSIYKKRNKFSHKGSFGYACLLSGSYGMMGAAVLAAKACLRSGVGKLTCFIPEKGYEIMQISVPEAMSKACGKLYIKKAGDIKNFNAIGVGPGIGKHESHAKLLRYIFAKYSRPIVIDADALNVISENKSLLEQIIPGSIVTPHPGEFERLFGKTKNEFERMQVGLQKANDYNIYIVLKGHHTLVCSPDKKAYFNSTGNAGMATGGSGDVLTGIITGLLAQGYPCLQVCLLGVYLHGLAGDAAAKKNSQEAMIAGDIIDCLGDAFKILSGKK